MSKEFRYRGKAWVILTVVISVGVVTAVLASGDWTAIALATPMALVFSWFAIASRWICKVALYGKQLRVTGLTGSENAIQLDQSFEFWEADGEEGSTLYLKQGDVKVAIQSTLEDFEALKALIAQSPGARPRKRNCTIFFNF